MPLENQYVCTFKESANDSKDEICNTDLENYSPGHRTFQVGAAAQCPLLVCKGATVSIVSTVSTVGKQH